MGIFNYFGSLLGYVLWVLYMIVQNYGVAIILFTLIVRAALFPFNIKQQRSTAAMARISAKQRELQQRYGTDRQKYQEEVQKLYDKEGVRPGGGCLTMLIPFPIMLGLYYTVMQPLSNALHLSAESVSRATQMLAQIPGIGTAINGRYVELEVVKNFNVIQPYLGDVWSQGEIDTVAKFSNSFNFLGLDLLDTPWGGGQIALWIIPILCLLFGVGTQVYSMFANEAMRQQQGCMKVTMLFLPLITAYLALIMPGAIGFYWVVSNAATFIQMFVVNKFYSKDHMIAEKEAKRIARREREELKVPEIPLAERRPIPVQTAAAQAGTQSGNKQGGNKQGSKKKKK